MCIICKITTCVFIIHYILKLPNGQKILGYVDNYISNQYLRQTYVFFKQFMQYIVLYVHI